MALSASFPGDIGVGGKVYAAGGVSGPGNPQYQQVYQQKHGTATATERRPVHVARGAGQILNFQAGHAVAVVGDSTVTVQLKKNGANVLASAIVLDSGNAAFAGEAAPGFTGTNYVAGDVFEVDVTAAANTGTLGQGLFAALSVREDA